MMKFKELMGCIEDFDAVKGEICFKLVSSNKKNYLSGKVSYEPFPGISMVFMIPFDSPEGNLNQVVIDENLQRRWGCSLDTLRKISQENTERIFPARVMPMGFMLAVTNQETLNGASVMMYRDFFKRLSKENNEDSFWVIPSSIHDLVVIPKSFGMKLEDVREIHKNLGHDERVTKEEDFLSDEIFEYDAATDLLRIAK